MESGIASLKNTRNAVSITEKHLAFTLLPGSKFEAALVSSSISACLILDKGSMDRPYTGTPL